MTHDNTNYYLCNSVQWYFTSEPIYTFYICALLGYYTAYVVNSLPTFRENLSVPPSRVKKSKIRYPWIWEREIVLKPRVVITKLRCLIPQKTEKSHLLRGGRSKSRICNFVCFAFYTVKGKKFRSIMCFSVVQTKTKPLVLEKKSVAFAVLRNTAFM